MQFHHVCLIVKNVDESMNLYRDILGFKVIVDTIIPDNKFFRQETLDDIFKVKGAKSRMVMAVSPEGALLEFQQPIVPEIQQTPDRYLRYEYTGFSELAFKVSNIESWFEKIKLAGFQLQTEYVWEAGGLVKSFLFFDVDGHMVQMCENLVDDIVDPECIQSAQLHAE